LPRVSTEAETPYSASILLKTKAICVVMHFQRSIFSTRNPRQPPWFYRNSVNHRHVRNSPPKIRSHHNLLLHHKPPPWNLHVLHARKHEHHTCRTTNKNQPFAANHKPLIAPPPPNRKTTFIAMTSFFTLHPPTRLATINNRSPSTLNTNLPRTCNTMNSHPLREP